MPPDQLATTAAEAATHYREGLALVLADRCADAIPPLRAAIAIDRRFALALAALAVAESACHRADAAGDDDGWDDDRWRAPIDLASRQRNTSRRERQHVAIIALALDRRLTRASALGVEHIQEFPDDELVLHVLVRSGVEVADLPLQHSVE